MFNLSAAGSLLLLIDDGRVVRRYARRHALPVFIVPALDFALEPLALFDASLLIREESKAILLAILPLPVIFPPVFPNQDTMALLPVVREFAFISTSVVPTEDS